MLFSDGLYHEIRAQGQRGITTLLILLLLFALGTATILSSGAAVISDLRISWQSAKLEPLLITRAELMIAGLESSIQERIFARLYWIDIFGLYQRGMGRRTVEDSSGQLVLKDTYGNLHFLYYQQDTTYATEQYAAFAANLQERSLRQLYVQLPNKKIPKYTLLPLPMDNRSNETADTFLEGLQKKDLAYLDLRSEILESGIPYERLFYRTDHHWQTNAAFWAANSILGYLSSDLGWQFSAGFMDISNYETITYAKSFLGSQGKRTGRFYAGVDDFSVIFPHHEGDFSLYANGLPEPLWQGTFRQTFIREEYLDPGQPVYKARYGAFLEYDMGLVQIINHELPQEKRILIIKDSFTQAMAPFLAQHFAEVWLLDLRAFAELNLDLWDVISGINPDLVMVIYNTEVFSEVMFTFK